MSEITWAHSPEGAPLVDDEAVERALSAALAHGGRPGTVLAVTFVGEEHLTELHAVHLDDPTPTDVITFDLGEDGEGPSGELYVSVDRARDEAAERGTPFERELLLYVVHGALHLCGLDDHTEEDRRAMRAAEAHVLADLGFEPEPGASG